VSDIFIGVTIGLVIASLMWAYAVWRQHAVIMDLMDENEAQHQRFADVTNASSIAQLDAAFRRAEDSTIIERLERMLKAHEIDDEDSKT
jgi:hypothetical protein